MSVNNFSHSRFIHTQQIYLEITRTDYVYHKNQVDHKANHKLHVNQNYKFCPFKRCVKVESINFKNLTRGKSAHN